VNTKLLLTASALVLGALGIAGSFLPQELLAALGVAPSGVLALLVQLLAALLFAFSMVLVLAGIYVVFAIGFAAMFVRSPVKEPERA